jgi:hypothetical protein
MAGIRSQGAVKLRGWPGKDVGYDDRDVVGEPVTLGPQKKLRDAVDLIVVAGVWKCEQLIEEVAKPGGVFGQADVTRLDFC